MTMTIVNMFNGITIPVTVVEGDITITETVSVTGDSKKPTLANPCKQGDAVAITGDFQVEKASGSNGVIIGFLHDHPEYKVDPATNYTKAQAISAGVLREAGVETVFSDIRTVPAKSGESITAGMYVTFHTDGQQFVKTTSSGTTESNMICLSGQTTDNKIVIGIK